MSQFKPCIDCFSQIHPKASVCPHCQRPQRKDLWAKIGTILKWIGGATAVFSLLVTMVQVGNIYSGFRSRQQAVNRLVDEGIHQRNFQDYTFAWDSFSKALELEPGHRSAELEQLKLAMEWVRNWRIHLGSPLASKLDEIYPVMYRGTTLLPKQQWGDVYAHLGWASYLRSRNGSARQNQALSHFKRAVEIDAQNPYANTFWAVWKNPGKSDPEIMNKYNVARQSGRMTPYLWNLQLSSFFATVNINHLAMRTAHQMRLAQVAINDHNREQLLGIYERLGQATNMEKAAQTLHSALQPKDLLAIFEHLLTDSENLKPLHQFAKAWLMEANGDRVGATVLYQALQTALPSPHGTLPTRVQEAIDRLSNSTPSN